MKRLSANILVDFAEPEDKYDPQKQYKYSFDNGKTWKKSYTRYSRYIDYPEEEIIKQLLNQYTVQILINPQLQEGEELCLKCMYQDGAVGIVRYAGIVKGSEAFTVVKYNSDGEGYTVDEYFSCRYAQWKCQRCGNIADSEYA